MAIVSDVTRFLQRALGWGLFPFGAIWETGRWWRVLAVALLVSYSTPVEAELHDQLMPENALRGFLAESADEPTWIEPTDFTRFHLSTAATNRPTEEGFTPMRWAAADDASAAAFVRLIEDSSKPSEPDISFPGPDFGDFPNSAFTLPKGRSYIEYAPFSYSGKDRQNPASNSGAYLLRYGITDDVELRLAGAGLVTVFEPGNTVTGFAPLIIDTKIHLWNEKRIPTELVEILIPAVSLEAYIQTNLASSGFQGGVQPSLNLNMDFPITKKTNIEMTFGYTGVQDAVNVVTGERFIPRFNHPVPTIAKANLDVNQFSFQWAIEQQVTEKLQLFLHGYYNGAVLLQTGPGRVAGAGFFYQFNKRLTSYGSYNVGLDSDSPPILTQVGFAAAF